MGSGLPMPDIHGEAQESADLSASISTDKKSMPIARFNGTRKTLGLTV